MIPVSKELAVAYVHETPFGPILLGVYESLAADRSLSPKAEVVGDIIQVSLNSIVRVNGGGDLERSVSFFTNGEFTNVRVRNLSRREGTSAEEEGRVETGVIFSIETGTFDRSKRRVGGIDLVDASFNGRVLRPDSGLYPASSRDYQLYRQALVHLEAAFVNQLGSTNKIGFLN